MSGIVFNNKHSLNDFELRLKDRNIGQPQKNKIKETVPFMNGAYDFSSLYGEQTYSERTIAYTFMIFEKDKNKLYSRFSGICNWLKGPNKSKLTDDNIKNYYFEAECLDVELSEGYGVSEINVTFIAYPFMFSEYFEGNDIWDIFNFELDYTQDVAFEIVGSKDIAINNSGSRSVTPEVICDSVFEVTLDNITYIFNVGTTKDWRFILKTGLNNIRVSGNGSIEFRFKKELL